MSDQVITVRGAIFLVCDCPRATSAQGNHRRKRSRYPGGTYLRDSRSEVSCGPEGHVIDLTTYVQENREEYYRLATTKIEQDVARLARGWTSRRRGTFPCSLLAPFPLLNC